MTPKDKANVLVDALVGGELSRELRRAAPEGSTFRLYAWRMRGTSDVKLIAALNDESAARIAVAARIAYCEESERDALHAVLNEDRLARVDPDVLFQGESPLWDGGRRIAEAVEGV